MLKGLTFASALAVLATTAVADVKTYDFQGFEAIKVDDAVIVQVTAGPDFAVAATGSSDVLDQLEMFVADGALSISRTAPWGLKRLKSQEDLVVTITMPQLDWIGARSGADLRITGGTGSDLTVFASSEARISAHGVDYAMIDADVRNGAALRISGQCDAFTGVSFADATLNAVLLDCAQARTNASGGGQIMLSGAAMDDLWEDALGLDEDVFAATIRQPLD